MNWPLIVIGLLGIGFNAGVMAAQGGIGPFGCFAILGFGVMLSRGFTTK